MDLQLSKTKLKLRFDQAKTERLVDSFGSELILYMEVLNGLINSGNNNSAT